MKLPDKKHLGHLLYASGNMGKSGLWSFMELFALFYLTDVIGIPAQLAGTIILLSLVWDGLTDPLMGVVADRLRQRIPTVRPYFILGAPVAAGAFIALFCSSGVNADYRILYIFLVLMIFRTAYTVVDVPHNSMLSFLSNDSRERTNIASMRIFFSAVGKFAVTLLSVAMFDNDATATPAGRFSTVAAILAIAYLVILAGCFLAIRRVRIQPPNDTGEQVRFAEILASMLSNTQLLIVFGLTAVTSLATPVIGVAIVYYGKYGLGNTEVGAATLAVMSVAQAVSLFFWARLTNRLSYKRHSAQLANLLLGLTMIFAILGMSTPAALYAVGAAAGFAIGGIYMLNWSMLPDALDYGEKTSSHKYNMSVFGLYTLANKGCNGLSQAIVGVVLAFYGYEANSVAAISTIEQIMEALLAFALAGAVICSILLRWHIQPQLRRS